VTGTTAPAVAEVGPADAARTPSDFRVLLPPGWVRIPLDERTEATVVALAAARARVAPADQREAVRTGLVSLLGRAARDARSAGGIDLLLSVDALEGVPVPASCLVSYVEAPDDADVPAVAAQLGGPGVDVSVAELAIGPAVRRQATRWAEDGGVSVVVTEVAYWARVPGRDGFLVLAFSTPSVELAPVLLELFDAMGSSLRWVVR
jgi:hypothetical protein